IDRKAFEEMAHKGELCEWAEVHGNLYGTPRANLEEAAARGEYVVLDIDVQVERLTGRKTEASGEVARRLRNARAELDAASEFDYVVVNDQLDRAVLQVQEIVRAEGHRPGRAQDLRGVVERIRSAIDKILEARFGAVSR